MIFWASIIYAQNASFYLELKSQEFEPVISFDSVGNLYKVEFNNKSINSIFSKYEIYKFEKEFLTARNPRLRNTFIVEANDIDLMDELKLFKTEFRYIAQIEEPQLNYTPNDFGGEPNSSVATQSYLDLCNVRKA